MKKLTKVLALVAMAAALFIGCSNSSTSGNGGDSGTKNPETKVVFEGERVLEITKTGNDAFNNYVEFAEAVSGYTTFEVTYSWESDTGVQCQAQLMKDGDQASETVSSTSKAERTITGKCMVGAQYDDWSTGSAVKTDCATSANRLQVYLQNSEYKPTTGKITVKKVVLK